MSHIIVHFYRKPFLIQVQSSPPHSPLQGRAPWWTQMLQQAIMYVITNRESTIHLIMRQIFTNHALEALYSCPLCSVCDR